MFRCQVQSTVATVVGGIHVRAPHHQQMDGGDVPLPDGVVQRKEALCDGFVDLCAARQYNPYLVHLRHPNDRVCQGPLQGIRALVTRHRHL